jgi:protein-S-isoprenylcysteine O-methyltransferase Ste14
MFVKQIEVTDESGIQSKTKEIDYIPIAMAMVILFIILAASFYANSLETPWESASNTLLAAFTSGIGLVIGAILGESAK